MSPLNTHILTHTKRNKRKNNPITTNLTISFTMCDVNTEVTIRHNMTSTDRVYIPYALGTIIK